MTFTAVFFGMRYGVLNVRGSIQERNKFFLDDKAKTDAFLYNRACLDEKEKVCDWNTTPEWSTISGGLKKDADIINRISNETGIQARMIASVVTPEQTRFFTSNREVWKSYFEPLKVLISLSKFSLGISGVKQDTAKAIEVHASDANSPFYPGPGMSDLLAYKEGANHDTELYNRLTDDKDHYYQYLYTAIYVKEIMAQWQKAGYDISHNPETVVTLFNLGFVKSVPNKEPVAGGAPITLGGKVYSYGELGSNFYYSNELIDIFPKVK